MPPALGRHAGAASRTCLSAASTKPPVPGAWSMQSSAPSFAGSSATASPSCTACGMMATLALHMSCCVTSCSAGGSWALSRSRSPPLRVSIARAASGCASPPIACGSARSVGPTIKSSASSRISTPSSSSSSASTPSCGAARSGGPSIKSSAPSRISTPSSSSSSTSTSSGAWPCTHDRWHAASTSCRSRASASSLDSVSARAVIESGASATLSPIARRIASNSPSVSAATPSSSAYSRDSMSSMDSWLSVGTSAGSTRGAGTRVALSRRRGAEASVGTTAQ